jgi:thermostable 8-oxoguanine DNA glycosylase
MISIEISGIGFPLACDFLKEIGFVEYGKPDVHLKDIFKALGIIDPDEKSVTKQDYASLKAIDRIANACNVTPFAVDKVFWLIGSGNFYLTGINIGRQKQKFINQIKMR